jgi:hypothetical protein
MATEPGSVLDALIMAQSPWAYYKLDETSGTTFTDSSGNGRHLTVVADSPEIGRPPLIAPGYCVRFGFNSTDYIRDGSYHAAVSALVAGNKEFTLETIIQIDSLATTSDIIHLGNAIVGGAQGVVLRCNSSGSLRIQFYTGSFLTFGSATGAISTGAVYHVAARRKTGGVYDVFLNGSNVANGTNSTSVQCSDTTSSGGTSICLGATYAAGSSSNYMHGSQDYTAIYAAPLTDAEIMSHAQAAGLA